MASPICAKGCHPGSLQRDPRPTTFVVQPHSKGITKLKLTIDSTEALEDTLRVVGALYNVTLEVAANPASDTGSGTNSITRSRSAASPASTAASRAPRKSQKRKRPATTMRARSAAHKRGRVDTATVRAWARENDYEIADPGRVPAAVLTAYQQALGA